MCPGVVVLRRLQVERTYCETWSGRECVTVYLAGWLALASARSLAGWLAGRSPVGRTRAPYMSPYNQR